MLAASATGGGREFVAMSDPRAARPIAIIPDGSASPAGADAAIPELLSAGLSGLGLLKVMQAVGRWWGTHFSAERLVIGVRDEFWRGVIVTESGIARPLATHWIDDCVGESGTSIRETLAAHVDRGDDPHWFPFGDSGQVFGGLLSIAPAAVPHAPPPALWLDVTARLLAAARLQERRLLTEKLAALAEFAAGAGHEINNPLGSILGRVQLLTKDEPHPERRRMLANIGAQVLRVRDMIGDAMLFARPPAPRPEAVSLYAATLEVAEQFRAADQPCELRLKCRAGDDAAVWADPVQLRIVVSELIRNALQAGPSGSAIEIRVSRGRIGAKEFGWLEVLDQGPGLSALDRQHLFDPFYSGRQAGRGLGFGLSKCWRIVDMHGGDLHAAPAGPGLRMIVHWPLATELPATPPTDDGPPPT
jgi:signal transduction histidine kinase